MYSEYDCAFNKKSNHEMDIEEKKIKLKGVTHVMDCECFFINGKVYYREVSIFDMKKNEYESFQCYAEDTPDFHYLDERSKKCVKRQWRIHGLRYYNYKKNSYFFSQEETLEYLKRKFAEEKENILIGYKGGDLESRLCKRIGVAAMNLEHFSVEKYEFLIEHYKLNIKRCKGHSRYILHCHCSLYEVILFAARICEIIFDLEKAKKIISIYGE